MYVEIDRESNNDDEDYSGNDSATNDEDDKDDDDDNNDDDDSGTDHSHLHAAGSLRRTPCKSGSLITCTPHFKHPLAAKPSPVKGKASSSSGGNV